MPEYIKNIKKTYKDYVKIIEYDRHWIPTIKTEKNKKPILKIKNQDHDDLRNVIRAKTAIHDIVACNTFEYFVTLTISPKAKINRYNYDETSKTISKWLNNHLKKYLLVPEKHQDGAYHFHLLADIPKAKIKKHKGKVYNIKSYKLGYSTAIKITKGSEARIANYVQKYITKDLIKSVGKGRRRYWASKNLARPQVEYNVKKPNNATLVYKTEHIKIYTYQKTKERLLKPLDCTSDIISDLHKTLK